MFRCSSSSWPSGASGSIPYVSHTPLNTPHSHLLELFAHGTMPPSTTDWRKSNTLSGSTSIRLPKPLHVGQAPYGLLKENSLGEGSSNPMPQATQANFSEKSISSPSTTSIKMTP